MPSILQNCQVHFKKKVLSYTTEILAKEILALSAKSTGYVAFKQNSLITSLEAQKANKAVTESLSGEELFTGSQMLPCSHDGRKVSG